MALGHGEVAKVNRYLVLEYFRTHPGSSRSEAGEALALSNASVSRIVAEMLRDDVLVETGIATNTEGAGGPGRPGIGLQLRPEATCVAAIDLGGTRCQGRLSDLDGHSLVDVEVLVSEAKDSYRAMASIWDSLEEAAGAQGLEISGLVIGIPAVLDPHTGLVWRGPNVGWEGFDLQGRVEGFGVPFVIENDTSLSAIAERRSGSALDCRSFVLMSIGTGLGAAVMIDGALVSGHSNAAGELGNMVVNRSQVLEDLRGGQGGLESYLSGVGMKRLAEQVALTSPELREQMGADPTARELIAAAQQGVPRAEQAMEKVAQYLALAIINLSSVVDPELVVIDGSVGRALAPMFGRVSELVSRHIPRPPEIRASEMERSTMCGAITLAISNFRDQQAPTVLAELSEIRI